MRRISRKPFISLFAFSIISINATSLAFAQSAVPPAIPRDPVRDVMSFNGILQRSLPGIVRVVVIGRSAENDEEGVISSGSGIVIDAGRGEILTNSHVVENATRLQVQLPDGRTLDARLVGRDDPADIALLTVTARGLTAVSRTETADVRVGDLAFAVGYPLGLEQTVTMGIVSGLGRSGIGEGLEDYIQTDAPINSGNSGGALLDSAGRLVGINTAILSRSGGNIGIGFAVPVQMAYVIASQLREHGEVRRGKVGITLTALTPERATALRLESTRGALIAEVEAGSPAARGGLRPDDVIVEANGRQIEAPGNLSSVLGIARPGERVSLGYVRGGARQQVVVEVVAQAPTAVAATTQGGGDGTALGALFRDIRSGDPYPTGARGAVVTTVRPGSIAAARGLQAGDLIVSVDNQPVTSASSLIATLRASRGPSRLVVARGNSLLPLSFGGQ